MSADRPLTSDAFDEVGLDDWRRRVADRLGDTPVESLARDTPDGVELKPLYTAADLAHGVPVVPARSGEPGAGWRTCARLDQGDAVDAAAGMAVARTAGATACWIALDRAARLALEPDSTSAAGHVGHGGLALHHGSDLALLADGLELSGAPLAEGELWLDAGGNALPAISLLVACFDERGTELSDIALHCGADPFGSLARDGRLPRDLMKLESEMAVLARFSHDHLEGGRAIVVSTEAYHNAGATVVQELAWAVATTSAYLRALEESGLEVETGAVEMALRFAIGSDLFVEIAKLRAARLLWSMLLRGCGVEEPPPALVHAVGSRRTATRRDPFNNLLRSSGQAFAAACGGADLVSLDGFDRLHGAADQRAWRLAQTTQVVLAEEALLGRVTDPGAGSYYVERLTYDLARQAWTYAQEIERAGGMKAHLLSGRIAAQAADAAEARRVAIEDGRVAITGVTTYVREDEEPLDRTSSDRSEDLARVIGRLEAHRATRIAGSDDVAYSRNFVVDELVARAARGGTLAEISLHLGDAEGAESIEPLAMRRDAESFEGDLGGSESG